MEERAEVQEDQDENNEDNLLSFNESMQDDEIKQDGGDEAKSSIDEMFLVN